MTTTLYIVPAITDQAGQCRIVAREGNVASAREDYRQNPDNWREVGIMNSLGKVVCLDNKEMFMELKADEPLMAGSQFKFGDTPAIEA